MIPNESSDILSPIRVKAKEYFSKHVISEALELLKQSRISVSYMRGRVDTYFIVSGIVNENRIHETKIVYKNNPTEILSSNCDCIEWNQEHHCRHAASLFFYYHLHHTIEKEQREIFLNTTRDKGFLGVTPFEYGTMIKSVHKLQGALPNSTYSTLNFRLNNNKIINFPLPKPFIGKIIIDAQIDNLSHEYASLNFKYVGLNNQVVTNISIFENMYLFNWDDGSALHIPEKLKSFFKNIIINEETLQLGKLLSMVEKNNFNEYLEISINGHSCNELPQIAPNLQITINPSSKRGHIEFTLQYLDADNVVLPIPYFLKNICFAGGQLGSFKKKKNAYDFLACLSRYSTDSIPDDYKKELIGNPEKEFWIDLVQQLIAHPSSYSYHLTKQSIVKYQNNHILLLLETLINCFGDIVFRFSEYNMVNETIYFHLPTGNLFQGLGQFYKTMSPYGVNIYYNKKEITPWKSRISFERRPSMNSWFNLNLDVPEEDLEVIRNANYQDNLIVTTKGLVLLTDEQKSLIKFMQKYTQYEAENYEKIEKENEEPISRFHIPFNKARIFELFELKKMGIEGALTKDEEAICYTLSTLKEMPSYPLPDYLEPILREYQKTGYNWLRFLYEHRMGACLADDMGLGKTIQTIALIKSLYDKINKVLIVCPVTIILNWEKEIQKFSDLNAFIYHGGARNIDPSAKIILTSYGIMKKEVDTTFKNECFDILIMDEVQHLKNIRSLGASSVRKINANFRICLTGTPVENDLSEFYNIIDLAIPGIWGDLSFIKTTSTSKSRLLARKTAGPFILRRTKAQVLTELPPKQENTVYLNFDEAQLNNYQAKLHAIKKRISLSPKKRKYGEILKGLLELRQQCLWDRQSGDLHSTKIDFLNENLEQIVEEGHQAIVFSQFTTYLDIIQKSLDKHHWQIARIDGTQSIKKRQEQVDLFQEGKRQIFLISLKAGGVGLNLTAASYVFVMDPWWNPAVENQAVDRAHRIGQKNTLTVYRPIIKNSVEENVLKLQEYKRELFLDLLPENDDQYFTGKLNMNDFASILGEEL